MGRSGRILSVDALHPCVLPARNLLGRLHAPCPITQLVHTRWTAKDGAPTEILTLARTTDGYLWLGTRWGLVRFDGVRFVQFGPRGGDTLQAGGVSSLLAVRDGSLWIVSLSGAVSRLRGRRVTTYGERDGLPAAFQLAESRSGTLVAGTAKPGNDTDRFFRYQPSPGQFGSPLFRLWRQGLPFPRTALRPGALGPE